MSKGPNLYADALSAGIINEEEYKLLLEAKAVKEETIMVDEFTQENYVKRQ